MDERVDDAEHEECGQKGDCKEREGVIGWLGDWEEIGWLGVLGVFVPDRYLD